MKKKYFFSTLFGLLCLYLAFRKVDWRQMGQAFQTVRYGFLPAFVVIHVLGIMIRGRRWHYLLRPIKKASYRNLVSAISIGFMTNLIFPARAGEFVRAYVIGRKEGISKTSSFATIVLERLFDGFTIISFLVLFPLFLKVSPGKEEAMEVIITASGVAITAYAAIMIVLFFFCHRRTAFLSLAGYLCRIFPRRFEASLMRYISAFGEGLDILNSKAHLLIILGWSFCLWTILGLGNWVMLEAFNIKLPIFAGLFLLVVQSFGVMFPSPGFVGTLQYAHVLGLSLFGVSREAALSLSIVLHGLIFINYVSLGIIFLWLEGFGLGEVRLAEAEN